MTPATQHNKCAHAPETTGMVSQLCETIKTAVPSLRARPAISHKAKEILTFVRMTVLQVGRTISPNGETTKTIVKALSQVCETIKTVVKALSQVCETIKTVVKVLSQLCETTKTVVKALSQVCETTKTVVKVLSQPCETTKTVVKALSQVCESHRQSVFNTEILINTFHCDEK